MPASHPGLWFAKRQVLGLLSIPHHRSQLLRINVQASASLENPDTSGHPTRILSRVSMPQACPAPPEKTLLRDQHPVAMEADETLLRTWSLTFHVEETQENWQRRTVFQKRHFQSLQLSFSHSVISNSLRTHGQQHARILYCPLSPGVCSNSCPLSQ